MEIKGLFSLTKSSQSQPLFLSETSSAAVVMSDPEE